MELEEILTQVKDIDECIKALQEQRLAVLRNDLDYAAYLDRTNGKLTISQFHTALSNLESLYRDEPTHDVIVAIVSYEQELGI